ncbi:MAG TPA: LLM class F420-dependent oxidoreductase [Acidimicrobiia bacterium]|nr:LLM class F420-dependent oxidoreductase [Acidimicrobiia bacterium]
MRIVEDYRLVKFAFMYANAGPFAEPENAIGAAQLTEELGFESLWTVEHTVVPAGYQSEYPYSPDGKMPGGENVAIPDPLIWLSYVGAVTKNLRLGTGILILPQRNPLTLAKEVATLDRLTGGRVELGIGVGWLREEFDALGIPFETRGARTDEHIEILRRVWSEQETAFDGTFTSFAALKSFPKPATEGGPRIHVGGHSKAAARRAGRLADGFFPGRTGEELTELVDVLRKSAADAGRNADAIEITTFAGLDVDSIKRSEDAGVARAIVPPLGFDLETLRTNLGKFSEDVVAKCS